MSIESGDGFGRGLNGPLGAVVGVGLPGCVTCPGVMGAGCELGVCVSGAGGGGGGAGGAVGLALVAPEGSGPYSMICERTTV